MFAVVILLMGIEWLAVAIGPADIIGLTVMTVGT